MWFVVLDLALVVVVVVLFDELDDGEQASYLGRAVMMKNAEEIRFQATVATMSSSGARQPRKQPGKKEKHARNTARNTARSSFFREKKSIKPLGGMNGAKRHKETCLKGEKQRKEILYKLARPRTHKTQPKRTQTSTATISRSKPPAHVAT